jgi:nitrate/nitrite transporter NarK
MTTEFLTHKKQKEKKEKYQAFILAIIVLAICFFIWLMGR